MKKNLNAIVFAVAIIIAAVILGNAYVNRNKSNGSIEVTGLGTTNFTSDLIVWEGSFSNENRDLKAAFNNLKRDKKIILDYLISKGINKDQIVFNAVQSSKNTKLSREVTELLNKGINFYSFAPRYYYTKLADLKIEMISKATEDAHLRAEKIALNSGGILGHLKSAKMGIFQITGQNSKEDYSWGGTFNTSSLKKTASITMKLNYSAK
ncbi:MAG: SIMPL domain-containing protein [Flavobacteriales bacterium]|jgi:uncharacterized protein|nr:SIMPL domain-containing protein [Flavobacteriales bacterium]